MLTFKNMFTNTTQVRYKTADDDGIPTAFLVIGKPQARGLKALAELAEENPPVKVKQVSEEDGLSYTNDGAHLPKLLANHIREKIGAPKGKAPKAPKAIANRMNAPAPSVNGAAH